MEEIILNAWRQVAPHLIDDPHDLAKRLARRAKPVLTRPPRAWCLAIRASDRRIDEFDGQDVSLNCDFLRQLCAPVTIPAGGLMLDELAKILGTTPMGLRNARVDGTLRTRHIKGLAGRRGKPVPLVSTEKLLDPNAKGFVNPDPAWSWTATYLTNSIPDDFYQELKRIPHYVSHVGRHRYDEHRHPELDDEQPRKSKRLPPPEPDLVWYKWSLTGDYFLGDDPSNWRKSPNDPGDRPPRWLRKRKQKRRPAPSKSSGSLHFNGHQWICPTCGRTCRSLFYPLPQMNLLQNVPKLAKLVEIKRPIKQFACNKCHQVRFFSRLPGEAWNQLVAYLTAGLLYGREVPRPAWFTKDRKRPYKPHFHPRPAFRRQQVKELLLQGRSRPGIAAKLNMKIPALTQQINKIYKSERLRGQRALLLKHDKPLPARLKLKRHEILDQVRAGRLSDQIARELHVKVESVERYMRELRRRGELSLEVYSRPRRDSGQHHNAFGSSTVIG